MTLSWTTKMHKTLIKARFILASPKSSFKPLAKARFIVASPESSIKGAFSFLRQFLTPDSTLEMMKNTYWFTLKAHFVLKVFKLS